MTERSRPPESTLAASLRAAGLRVLDDPDVVAAYSRDLCALAPAGSPAAVVRAGEVEDVSAVLGFAHAHAIPVVPRGAGTGLSGAANGIDGGIVLDVSPMDRILELDPIARTARVQPGVINGDLDRAARDVGLSYSPDPGSRQISTIGGNIATNAGGMCCVKYGVTRDHVLELSVVLADGSTIRLGSRTRKNVVGLDLMGLFVGSEGTLGVIVEATVRLLPLAPEMSTVVAGFSTFASALEAVRELSAEGLTPRVAEVMDRTTIAAVNRLTRMGLDDSIGGLLLLQSDGVGAVEEASRFAAVLERRGVRELAVTHDVAEGGAMLEARRAALPALEQAGSVLLDDVCVPVHRLAELQARIERVARERGVTIGCFGHAADGNLHPTIVYDAADPASEARAEAAFEDILAAATDLEGTLSGEHGIGTLKLGHLASQLGRTELDLMARIKKVFDPRGILNPGKGY